MKKTKTISRPFGYNTHRESDRAEMLQVLGMRSIDDLFKNIPKKVRLDRDLDLPMPLSEWELENHMRTLASKNETVLTVDSYLGGGAYQHYIPAVCDAIVNRGEFLTAYTPYQPEMSQGLLQALFEFQQLISKLFALPAVHSSVYDGAIALAESAWMMCGATKRKKIIVSTTVWAEWQEVIRTYMKGRNVEIALVDYDKKTGKCDTQKLKTSLKKGDIAGILLQSPNALGVIEDIQEVVALAHKYGSLLSVSTNPISLGVLEAPGKLGADIASCEAQPLGIPLQGGGPYLGVIGSTKELEQFLPGRIVGELKDIKGARAYALVKEEREQHMAREEATSHICSNQALLTIRAACYLACVGEEGFKHIAQLNFAKAHYLAEKLCAIPGVRLVTQGEFFNEFTLHLPSPVENFIEKMHKKNIFVGITSKTMDADNCITIAVTEVKSKKQLDHMAKVFAATLTS